VTETLRTYLLERIRMPASRVRVIGNGVDVQRFAPVERDHVLAGGLGIPEGAFVVGTVARLHAVKNHALLLEAFARFQRERPNSVLLLVGEGELRSQLAARAAELGIAGRVLMPGTMPDTAPVYRLFDVFVLSSVIEGTSMSALEAMASGVPVVATAVGGNPLLLNDGEAGMLVPTEQVEPMANALLELAADADRRTGLIRRARKRVVDRYSDDAMFDAYETVYGRDASRGRPLREASPTRSQQRA
jgi:glycosyltransferase involved in cell wall biosynthesis